MNNFVWNNKYFRNDAKAIVLTLQIYETKGTLL